DIIRRAEYFQPVQVRHMTLAADDLAGETERVAEVGVPRGDDSADQAAVVLVVEEPDDLLGNSALLLAAPLTAPIGGGDEHIRLVDDERLVVSVQRDAAGGKAELLDESCGVTRDAREVDQERRRGRYRAHAPPPGFLFPSDCYARRAASSSILSGRKPDQ